MMCEAQEVPGSEPYLKYGEEPGTKPATKQIADYFLFEARCLNFSTRPVLSSVRSSPV